MDEEELCVIPMGGSLPKFDQRVVGFAGAGGLVHASTGYMQVSSIALPALWFQLHQGACLLMIMPTWTRQGVCRGKGAKVRVKRVHAGKRG